MEIDLSLQNDLKGKKVDAIYTVAEAGFISIAFEDGSYMNVFSGSPIVAMVHTKGRLDFTIDQTFNIYTPEE